MTPATRIFFSLILLTSLPAIAQDKPDWEAIYKKLMSAPESRAEIERKGASKEEVIAWLKSKDDKAAKDVPSDKMADKNVDWDAAYEKLIKNNPDVARKVENGDATKADVIAWMKRKAGGGKGGKKKFYGAKIEVKDPRGFKKEGEKNLFSGPQPGEKLPPFKVVGLHGERKGKEYDPVVLADGKPLVLIFQDNQVPGQKGLLLNGQIFESIAKNSPKGLEVHSVFLVDDPTPENVFEYDFKNEIAKTVQMSVSKDRRDGPGSYGLNRNLGMTLIVARNGKVLHNFPLAQPLLYPNPYVLGAIAEAVEAKPKTLVSWINGGKAKGAEMMGMKKQDGDKSDGPTKESDKPKMMQRGEEAARMQRRRKAEQATDVPRRRRVLEVKDPAAFAKLQDTPIFSGPQPSEKLPTFESTSLLDDNKGEAVNIIADAGAAPQMLVFQDRTGVAVRGLFGMSDAINKIKQRYKDLKMSVVFLDDDKESITQFASRFAKSLQDRGMNHIAMSDDGRDGPGNYGLNRKMAQTIILAKDGKVTHSFVFPQGTLYADPHVLGGIAELVGASREEVAKLVAVPNERERRQMTMRRQQPQDDPKAEDKMRFREKLGEFVRSGKLTRPEAGELWKAAFGDAPAVRQDRPAGDREMRRDGDRPRDGERKRDSARDGK